jgi:hypothetical protein
MHGGRVYLFYYLCVELALCMCGAKAQRVEKPGKGHWAPFLALNRADVAKASVCGTALQSLKQAADEMATRWARRG